MVTGFVLAAPVVSGHAPPSADEASGDELVVMGLDGAPTSATFASAAATLAMDADGTVRVEKRASRGERAVPPVAAAAPAPSSSSAPPSSSSAPAPAPAPVEMPVEAPPPSAVVPEPAAPERAAEAPAGPVPATTAAPQAALPAAPAPPPPAAVPAGSDRAGQVLALVNQERAAAGCRPLAADARLADVAAAHSADMRDRGFFDHVNLAGLSPFDRAEAAGVSARAENIARGQGDAAAVMASWMGSPGHRSNILDCSLTRLGVGIADGGGGPWWTQLFA
ncbi:CAP domain-containing protein [Blastococcus sp. TF02-09]|nr:CAP domain-containing protein [Blastococcus sp. TF02-9]